MSQTQSVDDVCDMRKFSLQGLDILESCWCIIKRLATEIFVPTRLASGSKVSIFPPLATSFVPDSSSAVLVSMVIWLTEAIDGRASPENQVF